ncbi:P-loop containing nucleoside triphosphate hydrolase protein [Hortaea werneckii]|nr:P-loop containing nucleoside triphosphate hydrolase protein [Hortaea werneckii]KAI6975455.1 P-loop containing nucleoside triphosphate hydrolase protein [Hortaea werneckii]KAI7022300.1 P-loop containing nucleoside triphosphate hydrolase protein [Hortaea werneckii]KAI7063820.1 P-loop containing nucleoside triphosphate hydrolase protein [Hortaea werneckii]KAI7132901.1 P-loop containing nucleoside triphosphate hydrolase protein [Hortaea werneckii]
MSRQQSLSSSDSEAGNNTNNMSSVKLTPDSATSKDTKDEQLVRLDPNEIGMSCGFKNLYSGKEDKHGRFQWQTTIPEDLGKPAEDAESEKWAIVVRNVKTYNDPKKVLSLHSILVQSPLLKDLLKDVLDGYPGVTVGLKRLEFSGRFEPLIHRWAELTAAIDKLRQKAASSDADSTDVDRLQHAELLQDLLAKEFKETIEASTDLKEKGVMTYEHLWTLFQPSAQVYSRQMSQDRIFKLISSKYGEDVYGNPVFWLTCQYVEYDGTRWGTNKLNVSIPAFEGTKPITSLPTMPLEHHSTKDEMKAKLIERGGKVEKLAGSSYCAYNGVGWRLNCNGDKDKFSVKGRIVVDTYGWNKFNPNMCVYVTALHIKQGGTAPGLGGGTMEFGSDDEYEEPYGESDGGMPVDGFFADEDDDATKKVVLSDEQKMICTPLVRGYALKEKLWLNFFVNAVHDIEFSDRAFESLVLPRNQKELILGFTATQQSYMSSFDDVVAGKGRGIVLLLCGPPGVGKTLTAESVAEEMKVPLYMMSAGDLGLDPRGVESKLQGVLDMCTRWNALLLLDEADIFLEQRSLHELERNKLVSIFLRVLEYYEGIMFLTTNRVETFDPAFQSRIHISIQYEELDVKSRKTVWENFLKQHNIAQASARERTPKMLVSAAKAASEGATATGEEEEEAKKLHHNRTHPHQMDEQDIVKLAQLPLNGRQIKNILKTAQLLAGKRGEGLKMEHVDTVMEVTQHLHKTKQASEQAKSSFFY